MKPLRVITSALMVSLAGSSSEKIAKLRIQTSLNLGT